MMPDESMPVYAPECRASPLNGKSARHLNVSMCRTKDSSACKFADQLGDDIVLCRHPLHAEIVARTEASGF